MRNPNSASLILYRSNRPLLVALSAVTLIISFGGCSPLAVRQPVNFAPAAQSRAASPQQQQSINEILKRQDEMRAIKAAEAAKAAAKAEAEAAAKAAMEGGDQPTEQQADVTSNAAARATPDLIDEVIFIEEPTYQVAQVSYETDVEEPDVDPQLQNSFSGFNPQAFAAKEIESVKPAVLEQDDSADNGVRLVASVDDLEGVPSNTTRQAIPYSANNQLRTANDFPVEDKDLRIKVPFPSDSELADNDWSVAEPVANPKPILFNPVTRVTKPAVSGTLRPLASTKQEIEPEVTVKKSSKEFSPLSPLRPATPTNIKLEKPRHTFVPQATSRLLQPMENPQPAITWNPPEATRTRTPEIAPNDFVVREFETPSEPQRQVKNEFQTQQVSGYPIVDASLATATASYLRSDSDQEETLIPAEISENVEALAGEFKQALSSIPVENFEAANNDFKAVTTPEDNLDLGTPLVENNDFAVPESPGGDFVAPMTITPVAVPKVVHTPMPTVSDDFGKPVKLQTPPETNSFIARVAALPTNGNDIAAAKSKIPPVGVSTLMELDSVTWKTRLDEAIELAEQRLNRMKEPADSERVNLRLLKALRGQMEQMESSPPGAFSANEAQYWQHQLEAITAMLGTPASGNQAITDYRRHQTAHKTLEHLRHAVSQLESMASLKVTSGHFCTEITGFGQFRTFASNEFSPGQKMLVYCEVENYRTLEHPSTTGNDFHTRLRGSFAIYDSNGKVAQQAEYPTVDDVARKRRRDFYMYMPVTLGDLPPGQYVLHALVEDVHGNKTASLDPPLPFSVK